MGKKKIIIDTNNLISALGWGGKPQELLERVIDKEFDLYLPLKQIVEIKRVIDYPKFKFTQRQKRDFLAILFKIGNIVDTTTRLDVIELDPSDNMLLECAMEVNVDYIISGDGHLKNLKQFKQTKILSVGEFLKLF